MNWHSLPLTEFARVGRRFAVKVAATAVGTSITDTFRDENVCLDLHSTEGGRLVGYTLKGRKTKTRPLLLVRPMFLGLFYTSIRELERLPMVVMYYDYNVRLLAFGEDRKRDYMMVLRSKQDSD
jgi:hypothetical protein